MATVMRLILLPRLRIRSLIAPQKILGEKIKTLSASYLIKYPLDARFLYGKSYC